MSSTSTLSDDQLDRYARHIVLREIGGGGQKRLLGAHALVVGAGGIGSPVIQYLAAAGVGRLTVVDDDHVALSNLQRQTLFATRDVGSRKVVVAANAVQRLNPDVAFKPIDRRIDAATAPGLMTGIDVAIDGTDDFATRLVVADAALAARVPLVSAAVGPFEGQVAVYRGWEADKPCYRCLVGDAPGQADATCADQGVLGALTGVVGSVAAIEAIRAIVPFGEGLAGRLLLCDLLAMRFRTVSVAKDPACRCGRP